MKRILVFSFACLMLFACSESGTNYRNPYLPNYRFSMEVNTNLPLYSGLASAINPQKITEPSTGTELIIMKISETDYRAWDAYCPNQYPASCSEMAIDGVNAVCSCDDFEYSLFTGTGQNGEYPMKPYRVQVLDSRRIRVYN
jgi:nitrite reductase/ring-hydroxylating ferredoxin subunit